MEQENADLLCDGYEYSTADAALIERDPVIVPAGGPSVEDSVITGSMNYFVEGVEEARKSETPGFFSALDTEGAGPAGRLLCSF